jgi:uncharacterized protein (DUF58 family)
MIMVLVFAGAVFKEVNLLLLLGGMMFWPLVFNWRIVHITLKGLEIQRKTPQAVCAGDPLTVTIKLVNKRKRFGSWAVTVEEQIHRISDQAHAHAIWTLAPKEKTHKTTVYFPYVPAGQDRIGTYRGRLVERGKYEMGPVRLMTRFPFGLFSRTISLAQKDILYVYPRLGRLTRNWLERHRRALAGADRRERRSGPEGDFYGVREWRSGDSLRYVHWRSSARTGKLVVRQFEQPRNRDVAILLDFWRPEKPTSAERGNVELAASFAATVISDLCRRGGSKVHLATFNETAHCLGGSASAALMQDMMRILAVLESRSDDCLPALLEHAFGRVAAGTEIILISTRAVDLGDAVRFEKFFADPHHRHLTSQIRVIDASDESLKHYFEVE